MSFAPPPAELRPLRQVVRLPADRPLWIVSDLHLGDGTPSDAFFGKDRHLLALLDHVDREGLTLVINGDAVDIQQALSFMRVVRAHGDVLKAMSRLGREGRLVYVIGNHDDDIRLFRDLLSFQVCDELHVGDVLLVRHGYEYDPYITEMLDQGQWHTYVHHLVERLLGTWIRIPIGEFYTWPNRFVFWAFHKAATLAWIAQEVGERLGIDTPVADEVLANCNFWTWANLGDSMGIFRPALTEATTGPWRGVVCGHSHVPGVVHREGRFYANSGSWTFGSSQYLVWDGEEMTCHDWLSGRSYGDELYASLLDGSVYERDVFQWWRESYLGWFRFRQGEERRGRLRHWESVASDDALVRLRPTAEPPRLRVVEGGASPSEADDRRASAAPPRGPA
ncbi:MAG: hypothetical protein H6732_09385 [Alphaproteobacteria bacterium]|nr:hypothetical protein [Alphaproteobacteria bacterium]